MRALLVAISHGEIQPIPNHRGAEAPPGAMVMVPDSWRMGVRLSHAAMLEEFRRRLQDAQTGWRRGDSLDEYAIFTRTIASHEVYIVDLFFAIGTMLMEKYCFSFEDITIAETGSGLTVVIRKEILPKILNILGLKLMST